MNIREHVHEYVMSVCKYADEEKKEEEGERHVEGWQRVVGKQGGSTGGGRF